MSLSDLVCQTDTEMHSKLGSQSEGQLNGSVNESLQAHQWQFAVPSGVASMRRYELSSGGIKPLWDGLYRWN